MTASSSGMISRALINDCLIRAFHFFGWALQRDSNRAVSGFSVKAY